MRCRRQQSRRYGVTLLELVVSLAVASVTLAISLQLYIVTQRAIERQQVKATRLGEQSDLLSLLRRDARTATAIAPGSTETRLILISVDGDRTRYEASGKMVRRLASDPTAKSAELPVPGPLRFEYPQIGGRQGRVVRVCWGSEQAGCSITLHLRNQPM